MSMLTQGTASDAEGLPSATIPVLPTRGVLLLRNQDP